MKNLPALKRGTDDQLSVRRVQGLLIAAGQKLPNSIKEDRSLDGDFGDETEKALKALTGSITVGPREWKHLLGV